MGEAGVELEHLEDVLDRVAGHVHDRPEPLAVDGARPAPLLDRQPLHLRAAVAHPDRTAHRAVEDVDDLCELAHEADERRLGEVFVTEVRAERARVIGETALRAGSLFGRVGIGHVSEL